MSESKQSQPITRRQRRREKICAVWLFLGDVLTLALSFPLTAFLSAHLSHMISGRVFQTGAWDMQRLWIFAGLSIVLLLWLTNKGHYRKRQDYAAEAHAIIKSVAIIALCDSFLLFALKYDFSRLWLVSNWLVAALGLCMVRPLVKNLLIKFGLWNIPTVVVGTGEGAAQVADALRAQPYLGYDVREVYVPDEGDNLLTRLNVTAVNYVILATSSLPAAIARDVQQLLTRARVPFAFAPAVHGLSLIGMEQQILFSHDVLLMAVRDNIAQPMARVSKMLFDYVLAMIGLAVIWPLLLLLAFLIKIEDGGPVLYRQRRIGRGGREFDCFKFRTMAVDSDTRLQMILANDPRAAAEWAADHKLRDDPRVTDTGKFLRKISLDELPQLLNVLFGDMSLIGPRPITTDEVEKYGDDIGFYYSVRPGLTGLWQVSGRNNVSYARRVELDGWYSRNWSLWLDIVILLKTVPVLLLRKGSY